MDLRKRELKKIDTEIRELEGFNKIDSATIQRFKQSGTENKFMIEQISKKTILVSNRNETIATLKERAPLVNSGVFDNELAHNQAIVKSVMNMKTIDKFEKKIKIKEDDKGNKIISDKYYKSMSTWDKGKRDYKYFYKVFLKNSSTIPDRLTKKLLNLPNNKGYIWRGVSFYGHKPAERNKPVIMFEETRDRTLIIHEYHPKEYIQYHKKNGGKNVKVKHIIRKPIEWTKNSIQL